MKKLLKMSIILLLTILCFATTSTKVFATVEGDLGIAHSVQVAEQLGAKDFSSDKLDYTVGTEGIKSYAKKIMGTIRNVAVIVGVIALMIIGIKYMIGSVEEKADYKKTLMPLVIGIIVVMAATTIVDFIMGLE